MDAFRSPRSSEATVTVCPGLIDVGMVRDTINDARCAAYARSCPISRFGQSEEVAELVAFHVSDRAAFIAGASLGIHGGDLMIQGDGLPDVLLPGRVGAGMAP